MFKKLIKAFTCDKGIHSWGAVHHELRKSVNRTAVWEWQTCKRCGKKEGNVSLLFSSEDVVFIKEKDFEIKGKDVGNA